MRYNVVQMTATKDDIITLPNAHLRQRSTKIGLVDMKVQELIADMESATISWEASRDHEVGVALAAVQIDRLQRVIVLRNDFDDKENHEFTAFINPIITKYEGEIIEDYEGCLSVKNLYGKVPRHSKVRVKYMDIEGAERRLTAEGFLARIFQHEIDHVNGILFVDHIRDDHEAFYRLADEGGLVKLNYEKDVLPGGIFEEG